MNMISADVIKTIATKVGLMDVIDAANEITSVLGEPIVDAEPVIRCGKCKHYKLPNEFRRAKYDEDGNIMEYTIRYTEGVCRLYGCESDPDGFCYRGEGALSNREFKVVAHAIWKYNVDPAVSDSPFICSSCLGGSEYDSQFCPHCGATMDGVVE